MKKNISILICFFIIIFLISYNVYANFKISSNSISYNFAGGYVSVKDHLDDLINETDEISNLGNASTGNVMLNKTGYSKGTFITGTMKNYSGENIEIKTAWRENDKVKFYFPYNGYYGMNTSFQMSFGDNAKFYVKNDGYYSTKSVMMVPSNKVHTKVTLGGSNVTYKNTDDTSITSIYTEVGGTNIFKVIPNTGYYIDNLSCTDSDGTVNNAYKLSGYSLGDNTNGWNSQNITLTNNNISKDSSCMINAKLRTFNVTIKGDYVTASPASTTVKYGETVNVTLTNDSKYYFESMSCTNGYTANLQTGKDYYVAQTITISNNNNIGDTVCTVTMHARSYAATVKTCENENCGVKKYNTCENEKACGKTTISCPLGGDVNYIASTYNGYCIMRSYICPDGSTEIQCYARYEGGADPVSGFSGTYKYDKINSCACAACGVKSYKTCQTEACGYECPKGGTLNTKTKMCEY